ncbi:MAG: crossover junction endodeoxyribonuclease RuvC [Pyrinomonadaceae bacterium]|nr:crossover junction endodeoxyribonuclease RuvC [Pyrinomonadaceae bacterium]MCX7640304.1 crossover junction endodeoxyribonuclease RuvC [Pyrinomonadaceae bacterium]MDW8303378.1 crossover junction endodeoxyribonuclease RuvC [Acidobacteriota bacterium]
MKVLGIDPGSKTLGWGVIEGDRSKYRLVEYGTIKSSEKDKFSTKLLKIFDKTTDLIERFKPDVLSIEEVFYAVNVEVALKLGQVRGVVMLAAEKANLQIVEYPTKLVKQTIVGYGNAEKRQVQEMVKALLKLKERPEPHDAADALALAICYFHVNNITEKNKRVF